MHDYSSQTINKRHDTAARKDVLLPYISEQIKGRGLRTPDLRGIDPTTTPNAVTALRQQDRSAASEERLEAIARGLGWKDGILGVRSVTEVGRMSFRDGPNGVAHAALLCAVSRAFCRLKFDRQQLRAEAKGYFGWDRLHNAALVLGVPIAPIWTEFQQLEAA